MLRWTLRIAGLLLALAAGTRLSLGVWLPVAGLALVLRRREQGNAPWLAFGLAGAVTLAIVYLPFLLFAGSSLKFGLLDYHAARHGGEGLGALAFKAGFISRTARVWLPALTLLAVCGALAQALRGRLDAPSSTGPRGTLWTMAGLITLTHLLTPFPYDDYQVVVFPLVAALAGSALARLLHRLTLPDEATFLWLSSALDPQAWGWGGDGVTFAVKVRSDGGEVFFDVTMHDAWVWDIYRPARFAKTVRVVTFKDVNVEELAKSELELPKGNF